MNVPNQSKFILGTPIQEFNNKKFRRLFHLAKTSKELYYAKSYLCKYFARGKVGVYKWDPTNQIFEYYNKRDACESFIQSEYMIFKNDKGEEIEKFSIQSWFFRETPFFSLEVNPYQPLIYREQNGAYFINKFPGFLHTNPIPFNQFSKEIRDAVKLILNHMREVLCSSNKDQELYMMGLILRIAIGQKMSKSMFLYSGPGTGKTMLTWFLRMMVLGPKISTKTSNEKVITGSFNKELEGKVLLVLEEMSNSKSADWITFAHRLKDFIDSDTIMIEEKHKTPYSVKNITNLIINSNNSKTIRLDREDRRYFIPDISNKYVENGIGMDHYYAPLDKAIKNPEVGKAFYSYALEYVKLNPNFNERNIPMSKTKLMMINRDNNPVYQFIKEKYIYNSIGLDVASSYLYNTFKDWFYTQINTKNRKPPTIQEFTCAIKELGLNCKQKRVGERKNNKKMQWYETSYENLYTIFLKRNMIDETENLDIPDGFNPIEKTKTLYTENFPLDLKDHCSAIEEPLQDVYGVPGPSNTSKQSELIPEPIAEPKSEPIPEPMAKSELEPISKSIAEPESESESEYESESESESKLKVKSTPEPIVYKNNNFEEMYINAKNKWEKFGNDPEDFDWECFITEIEELSNHEQYDFKKDPWHYTLRMLVEFQSNQINGKDIVIELRNYLKERGTVYIPSLTNHKTESIIHTNSKINIKECELAEDNETFSDSEDEDWYNGLEKTCNN